MQYSHQLPSILRSDTCTKPSKFAVPIDFPVVAPQRIENCAARPNTELRANIEIHLHIGLTMVKKQWRKGRWSS